MQNYKSKIKILAISFIFVFFAVNSALAISFGQMPSISEYGTDAPTVSDARTVAGYVQTVVKWAYTIFFIVAILFVLFSAYGYLTGADNPEAVSKAHKQLMYAAIAVIVALLAVSFNTIVLNLMTGGGGGGGGSYSGSGATHSGGDTQGLPECGTNGTALGEDNSWGDDSCSYNVGGNYCVWKDNTFVNAYEDCI